MKFVLDEEYVDAVVAFKLVVTSDRVVLKAKGAGDIGWYNLLAVGEFGLIRFSSISKGLGLRLNHKGQVMEVVPERALGPKRKMELRLERERVEERKAKQLKGCE